MTTLDPELQRIASIYVYSYGAVAAAHLVTKRYPATEAVCKLASRMNVLPHTLAIALKDLGLRMETP